MWLFFKGKFFSTDTKHREPKRLRRKQVACGKQDWDMNSWIKCNCLKNVVTIQYSEVI
jgi:hypothetical protein